MNELYSVAQPVGVTGQNSPKIRSFTSFLDSVERFNEFASSCLIEKNVTDF